MDIDAFDAIDNINNETPTITNTINPNETTTTTANVEAEITTYIILREQYVNRLKKALSRANAAQLQKRLLKSLDLLDMLRTVTLDIVEQIQHWRRGLPKPFIYENNNYLLKLTTDCDFLNEME